MVAANPVIDNMSSMTFSEKLGPVLVKELRQGLRAQRFVTPFLSIHALAILIVSTQFLVKHFAEQGGVFSGLISSGLLDQPLFLLLWLVVGIVMPLTGINSLQPEVENGRNIELLLMAGLTRWQIMRGKWMVLCALSALIMVSMLPYMFTLYFTGGVELVEQIKRFANIWIFNVVMSAATVGASGFRHLLARLATIALIWLTYAFTINVVPIPSPLSLIAIPFSMKWPFLEQACIAITQLLVIGLFIKYGLQVGRGSLRIFEGPMDSPLIGIVLLQIFLTPWVLGIVQLLTGPIGVIPLLVYLVKIDLTPDKKNKPDLKQ